MIPFEDMEQKRISFLYELYKRSEGDPRQGVPYEELVEALGLEETLMKRIQLDLQHEGLVELSSLPPITNLGRTVVDHEYRPGSHHTIAITQQGVQVVEDILSDLSRTEPPKKSFPPDQNTTP